MDMYGILKYLSFSGCINTSEAIMGGKPAISLSIGLVFMDINPVQLTKSPKEYMSKKRSAIEL